MNQKPKTRSSRVFYVEGGSQATALACFEQQGDISSGWLRVMFAQPFSANLVRSPEPHQAEPMDTLLIEMRRAGDEQQVVVHGVLGCTAPWPADRVVHHSGAQRIGAPLPLAHLLGTIAAGEVPLGSGDARRIATAFDEQFRVFAEPVHRPAYVDRWYVNHVATPAVLPGHRLACCRPVGRAVTALFRADPHSGRCELRLLLGKPLQVPDREAGAMQDVDTLVFQMVRRAGTVRMPVEVFGLSGYLSAVVSCTEPLAEGVVAANVPLPVHALFDQALGDLAPGLRAKLGFPADDALGALVSRWQEQALCAPAVPAGGALFRPHCPHLS